MLYYVYAFPQVTDRLFVAVGYALGNSILVRAPEGLIVVDTTETVTGARNIIDDFRKIEPNAPVKAIIYTHQHIDHIAGTQVYSIRRSLRNITNCHNFFLIVYR